MVALNQTAYETALKGLILKISYLRCRMAEVMAMSCAVVLPILESWADAWVTLLGGAAVASWG